MAAASDIPVAIWRRRLVYPGIWPVERREEGGAEHTTVCVLLLLLLPLLVQISKPILVQEKWPVERCNTANVMQNASSEMQATQAGKSQCFRGRARECWFHSVR